MYDSALDVEVPLWLYVGGRLVDTILSTVYFLLISSVAIAIDLSLHWFETTRIVQTYGLSAIIRWEIELMAYSLAGVDCFLFLRRLIEPVVREFAGMVRR